MEGLDWEKAKGERAAPETLLQKLSPRWFVARNVHAGDVVSVVQTRWGDVVPEGPKPHVETQLAVADWRGGRASSAHGE